ncbi:hypothetical protein O3G_MSEX009545 [Manduca sexta]|uniref:Embryonic stem cell-specific 5-hydroxymethylcytosine-binding protein n=1 Tax=Manduca sexta TaxID=7130 RepID=A0A922CRS9_MANSE|nr:hypothetical protein O3G_MSEX009545 [Manduca sexta]KAG6456068.1 hypothetical protein O3G_MSEX009545 [Manduca sexta]
MWGEYNTHKLTTNNCRLESIKSSKLYGPILKNGGRCIIVAEGFYEWQTTNKSAKVKQPYYIYAPQNDNTVIDDASTWRNNYNEETGWDGINLLHIAGLYDIWQNGDKIIYAYSVITMDSNETLSWLHSRMPAILDTQDQIDAWLDTENVNPDLALEHLKPVKLLSWHKVSTTVNNSRNKSDDCNKRMKVEESKKSQKSLTAWLTKPEKRKVSDECNRQVKKIKIESCTKSNSS